MTVQVQIDQTSAAGGGVVRLPAGIVAPFILRSGVTVRGAGIRDTVVVCPDGHDNHGITIPAGSRDVGVEDLLVWHARSRGATLGHGIGSSGCERFTIRRVGIYDAPGYGIGLQGVTYHAYGLIEHVTISRTGQDGIDVKNDARRTADIAIRNVTVGDHGLDNDNDAALDIRGRISLEHVWVDPLGHPGYTAGYGIRFRGDDGAGGNGGADGSQLVGYWVRLAGVSSGRAVFVEPTDATKGRTAARVVVAAGKLI